MARRGWHSRGYLPHFDGEEVAQFVTFRLGDAVPLERIEAWQDELRMFPDAAARTELTARIERYLDAEMGSAVLRDPRAAAVVERALRYYDGTQYDLHAWVVMPNHVHVLFTPREGFALAEIVQAWKSVSARRANRLLSRKGRLWQEDYLDRYMRDARHHERAVGYIEWNPVEARLCAAPEEWPFGSARDAAREHDGAPSLGASPPSVGARTPSSAVVAVSSGAGAPPPSSAAAGATPADEGVRAPAKAGATPADEGVRAPAKAGATSADEGVRAPGKAD